MMRVETVSGMLYFGDVYFGTEFIRIVPSRILVYSKEANRYMEIENIPKETFIPISRIEVVVEMPQEVELQPPETKTDEKLPPLPPLKEEKKK